MMDDMRRDLESFDHIEWTHDLGHGHRLKFYESDGQRAGALVLHPRKNGAGWCFSGIGFNGVAGQTKGWTVEQVEPLTLSPSLHCRVCGDHGFIRNGQWVPV